MARKSPTTGAKPNRDETQSYVAEDLWRWIKEHQNTILLVLTILVAGTAIYIMRSRAASAERKRAHQALGQVLNRQNQSEQSTTERIKRLKSHISRYGDYAAVAPWFYLHLADAYYMNREYDQAIETLNKLRDTFPDSPVTEQASRFIEQIRQEKRYVENELADRKTSLKKEYQRKKLIYGISDQQLQREAPPGDSSKESTRN